MTISNKRLYEGAIDCACLCKLHYYMSQIRRWLSKYVIDFLLVLMIARDWKYICCLWLSEGAIVFPLMQLNVTTYANSVIESSFTLIKFMDVLMNVYLRYSFNCWRKWLCILRKWTAKGVIASQQCTSFSSIYCKCPIEILFSDIIGCCFPSFCKPYLTYLTQLSDNFVCLFPLKFGIFSFFVHIIISF